MKKNNPIIVAQIMGKWVGGGVESVIMNYYRNIDKNKIQFDFICDEDSTNIPYEEIEKLGGRVILCPPYQKLFKYIKFLKKLFKENNYKIVHSNINVLSVFPLFAAKKAKVPVRIAHSHSTSNKKEWKKNIVKNILRPFSRKYATDYFACSELAARYLFGNRIFNSGRVTVINNAIDLDSFKYSKRIRNSKRKELNINDSTLVVGHIGRFVAQKNHDFLVDIFNDIHKKNKDSVLLLIGHGPKMDEIKDKIKSLKLTKYVKFLGQRTDVKDLYQAMDVFLFPSLYEGLGMVMVEAQISGLPCVTSTEVPELASVSNKTDFINLSEDVSVWSKSVLNMFKLERTKTEYHNLEMFSIKDQVKELENIYLNLNKGYKIELFGSPACGKSYFSSQVKYINNYNEKFIYNDNRVVRNLNKIKLTFGLFLFNIKYFIRCLKFIISNKDKTSLKKRLKMFLYMTSIIRINIKANNKNNTILFDEGIFQLLYGLAYNLNLSKKELKEFLNYFKDILPNEVIYLNVSDETLLKRLNERSSNGGSELEHDIKKDTKKLDYSNSYINVIKNIIQNSYKNIKFVEMDGE